VPAVLHLVVRIGAYLESSCHSQPFRGSGEYLFSREQVGDQVGAILRYRLWKQGGNALDEAAVRDRLRECGAMDTQEQEKGHSHSPLQAARCAHVVSVGGAPAG
jgi:hypothetical protein